MPAIEKQYKHLLKELGLTSLLMVPVSIVIVLISVGAMMLAHTAGAGEKTLVGSIFGAFQAWAFLLTNDGSLFEGDVWFILFLGLPYIFYSWIWIVGQFYNLKRPLIISIILAIHLFPWLVLKTI